MGLLFPGVIYVQREILAKFDARDLGQWSLINGIPKGDWYYWKPKKERRETHGSYQFRTCEEELERETQRKPHCFRQPDVLYLLLRKSRMDRTPERPFEKTADVAVRDTILIWWLRHEKWAEPRGIDHISVQRKSVHHSNARENPLLLRARASQMREGMSHDSSKKTSQQTCMRRLVSVMMSSMAFGVVGAGASGACCRILGSVLGPATTRAVRLLVPGNI